MVIGVYPARELQSRRRLFGALAQAFSVRFEPIDASDASRCAATVVFNAEGADPADLTGPAFVVVSSSVGDRARRLVHFGDSELLDRRLGRRALSDETLARPALDVLEGDHVLASVDGDAIWLKRHTTRGMIDVVACAPDELNEREVLRDCVEPNRFARVLPLIHFLRELRSPSSEWRRPQTRAAFVIDDPNLHWKSYGYLNFRDVVEQARSSRYHVAIAMVPLDGWYAHRPTVKLFRENADVLSLCVHGNDHAKHELGQLTSQAEAMRVVGQSVRRIEAFEQRTGLRLARVMAPPHEACSPASMQALLESGFEAATLTRPYPWLPLGPPQSPYGAPEGDQVLAGWHMAELVGDGLPVIVRRQFEEHDHIVLRAFLDQPIVLYGHVSDLHDGLDPLFSAAAIVNSLPDVEWGSLADIAETNFEWRRVGEVLEIRPYARRIRIATDSTVSEIRLCAPSRAGFAHGADATLDGDPGPAVRIRAEHIELPENLASRSDVEISWQPGRVVPEPGARGVSPRAVARRLVVEARDRLKPYVPLGAR